MAQIGNPVSALDRVARYCIAVRAMTGSLPRAVPVFAEDYDALVSGSGVALDGQPIELVRGPSIDEYRAP